MLIIKSDITPDSVSPASYFLKIILTAIMTAACLVTFSQQKPTEGPVVITGSRFTYPLIQKWIDAYRKEHPSNKIVIEPRGTTDPAAYDILVETYDQDDAIKKIRDYAFVGRYPILPVAHASSSFAQLYTVRGLTTSALTQLFFHDITADDAGAVSIAPPYVVYNRLQRAGAPVVFASYFGFAQKDIRGKAVAGSDEHLLKALLRDSIAVSYLPLTLIYDRASRLPVSGLVVLPVDLNGDGTITQDEKFYHDLTRVTHTLEGKDPKDISNVPIGYVHLSVSQSHPKPEAVAFIRWVTENGLSELSDFGYLKPDRERENSGLFANPSQNN